VRNLEEILFKIHLRLEKVTIESLDWEKCLTKYDRPQSCFFLDPPYWGCETRDYGKGIFEQDDFEKLAASCRGLKGHFILTMNDVPETRKIFKGFKIEMKKINYRIGKKNKNVKQLIISKNGS